jgi:dynein heavy chain
LLPDTWRFSIKKEFRIFISTEPSELFPTNFVRRCTKMALERPVTVHRNTMKNFNSIDRQLAMNGGNYKKVEFKKILIAVSVLHATVCRKEQFGPFGWSRNSYQFAKNDFDITIE